MMIIIDFKYGMMGQIQFIQDPSSHQMKLKNVNLASDWSILSTQSLCHSSVDIMFYPTRYPIIYISLQKPCCFNPREKYHYNTRQYIDMFIVNVIVLINAVFNDDTINDTHLLFQASTWGDPK